MFGYICFFTALAILGIALFFAVKNRNYTSKWITCIFIGIFFSTFFMVLPTSWAQEGQVYSKPLYSALSSLFYSFKAVGGGQDLEQIETIEFEGFLRALYFSVNYTVFALAPVLASGLLLSFIGDTGDKIRFAFMSSPKCYVFSEINPNSLALAKGIKKEKGRKTIVFCNAKNADKDDIAKVRDLGGIALYKSCRALRIGKRFAIYEFCLISSDEDVNTEVAEDLITLHTKKKYSSKIIINAFVESGTNVKFMENAFKSKNANDGIELRCIDEIALFCNSLVYNYPLYNTKGNSDTISVAIIGCGRTGMGMLRTVYWAGRIDGFKLKIRVYDKDADKIREELLAKCPQVSDDDTVRFINTEVSGADFREKILREENSADATYIVVAMNEDRGNLMVAEELYKLYRRHRGFDQSRMPEIFARVRSFVKSQPYFENAEFLKSRNINLFGTAESVFSGRTLFNTELENLAFAVHLAYWGALDKQVDEKEYSKISRAFRVGEYDRRSSMATALHIAAKLYMCEGVDKSQKNILTEKNIRIFEERIKNDREFLHKLAVNEHERWNAFMISEGYRKADVNEMLAYAQKTGSHKDELSMLHPCITDYENLDEIADVYNERFGKNKDFKAYDEKIIRCIPRIWEIAQKL